MTPSQAGFVLDALHGLARANWYDFHTSPAVCKGYYKALAEKRFKYVPDKFSCGALDCWSTARDMLRRYPEPMKVLGDCEDFACAYAGWLASQCFTGVEVGLVVGKRVSHAILAVNKNGERHIIDPSRWYGMPETHYNGAIWRKLQ